MEYPSYSPQSPLPYFGHLYHILHYGYLGRTFGSLAVKRHLCHNVLRYVEDQEDLVVNQELLRPYYSYPGLPGTFTVSHDLYSYVRCNSVGADNSPRIILDCEVAGNTTRVVPQSLFVPYAGNPRSRAVLQSTSEALLPPIFFIRLDHSVGLPLEIARSAESHSQLLLYKGWHPMEGKTTIKIRIAVRCLLVCRRSFRSRSSLTTVVRLHSVADPDPTTKPQRGAHHASAAGATRCQCSGSFPTGRLTSFFVIHVPD